MSTILLADAETHAKARAHKDELLHKLVGFSPYATNTIAAAKVFPRKRNLVGVGYGVKVTKGSHAADEAIRVYVRRKRTKKSLTRRELVPPHVNGCPTDVIAVGDIVARSHTWPTQGGSSTGHFDVTVGSIGCRVAKPGDLSEYFLSNNHILANANAASVGDDILQPGPDDGGDDAAPPSGDNIGQLAQFAAIDFNSANEVDAALARVTSAGAVDPAITGIGHVVNPPLTATLHQSVRKSGRTTGVTIGVIADISALISVTYGSQIATFDHQITITGTNGSFSDDGDSGALVVDAVTRQPVGLLFAGGTSQSFANPINSVLSHFGVTIV